MPSSLEKQPIKVIATIASMCMDDDFDYQEPSSSENYDILRSSSKWAGLEPDNVLDVEFISSFIQKNHHLLTKWKDKEIKFNEIANKFIIPTSKKFIVEYSLSGRAYLIERRKTDWESYNQDWIKDTMESLRSEGQWNYWEDKLLDTEYEDFEEDNFEVDYIDEMNKNNQKESIYSKLVLENTKDLLEGLDKNTLLKLKNLVESKLKFL